MDYFLQATKTIQPNEEIYVHYGPGYWADRFKKLSSKNSKTHSSFQQQIINAYQLQPLPDGTAITRKEALARRTISLQPPPTIVDIDPIILNPYLTDILSDTFGASILKKIYLTITSTLIHCKQNALRILTVLQTHHPRTYPQLLRQYLNNNPAVSLHI